MGLVRMGPPVDLLLLLRDRFNVKTFVEGGTYQGATASWAGAHFETVYSIERSEPYFEIASSRYKHLTNISFMLGDTRRLMPIVLTRLRGSAIFWLDSHWCGAESYGAGDECPLLDEIDAINQSKFDHFLLIDDARLFLAPPSRPHVISQWPTIDQVADALRRDGISRYIIVIDDVIIAVPSHTKDVVAHWCQNAVRPEDKTESSLRDGYIDVRRIKRKIGRVARQSVAKLAQRRYPHVK